MNISPAAAIFLSILMLLSVRFLFAMSLANSQSRKAQKRYRADLSFWNRWFFLSAPDYVQDKYSKLERKVIKNRATIRTMRGMNLLLHILLAAEVLVILLNSAWVNVAFAAYFAAFGGCFLLWIIIEWCNHPNSERMRHGRKPPNW